MSSMNIDFRRRPTGDPAPSHRSSQSPAGGTGGDPPERRSRTGSPDTDTEASGRNSRQQLKEYAVMCARRNRLSATAEEGLLEFVQLDPEKKLIHLSSGVAHIEQRLDRFEANTGASQPNLEPPSVPKKIKVDVFVNIREPFTDGRHENDIHYKAVLILMSTAMETNYHSGQNKPATMIMDSFRGNRDFDKSWLSGNKESILRTTVGKMCDDLRYELKVKVAESVKKKYDILALTVSVVSHFLKHCNDIAAHEGLAIRMAFLRAVYLEDSSYTFWVAVDKKLEEIRKQCAQPDTISFTEALSQIYNTDVTLYPLEDQSLLSGARPTDTQVEMNRHLHQR